KTTLKADLAALLRLWKRVQAEAAKGKGPRLLYSDQDLIVQALRDLLDSSIDEVLVDDDAVFEKAQAYMHASMPRSKTALVRYGERMPLFSRFNLESQIEEIYKRTVTLPGGGSIVIDPTEALTSIDVNSGKASHGTSQEDSIYAVNLEAAHEVARQLRLRDIGGLVVVDFIDMRSRKHQHGVEKAMRDAMKADKARSTVGRISPNGLLEINRQRVKQALALRTHRPCPTCAGTGTIPSPEFLSVNLLRRIEARAANGRLKAVRVGLHPELADALQNGRRQEIAALEREFDIRVEINATTSFHRSEEKVEWIAREAAQAPSALPAVSVVDLAIGGAAPDQPEAEKRRKRRRGGRRRKDDNAEPSAGEDAVEPAPIATALEEDAPIEGEVKTDAVPGEAPAGEKKRKRRRGGRRHKKGKGPQAPVENPDAGEPAAAGAPVPEEAPPPEPPAESANPEAGSRKKRRRHRRRRVPATPDGTAQEGGTA
ncbi:MAG: ribonuclease E, partial [Acidobacteria bacterium]